MTLGTALVLIAVLYLIDKHGLWKKAAIVVASLMALSAIGLGGWQGYRKWQDHRTAERTRLQEASHKAASEKCMARVNAHSDSNHSTDVFDHVYAEQMCNEADDPDKVLVDSKTGAVLDFGRAQPISMVTMLSPAPNIQIREIPRPSVQGALDSGYKIGVDMIAPDGSKGVIPVDRVHDALKAGQKIEKCPTYIPTGTRSDSELEKKCVYDKYGSLRVTWDSPTH